MANNYCQASAQIDCLTKKEHLWWTQVLADCEEALEQTTEGEEAQKRLLALGATPSAIEYGHDFELDEKSIWFKGEEAINIDLCVELVQTFLQKFRPNYCFAITWADFCSKLRLNEFGGGAAFVTAKGYKCMTTYEWVEEQEQKFRSAQAKRAPAKKARRR